MTTLSDTLKEADKFRDFFKLSKPQLNELLFHEMDVLAIDNFLNQSVSGILKLRTTTSAEDNKKTATEILNPNAKDFLNQHAKALLSLTVEEFVLSTESLDLSQKVNAFLHPDAKNILTKTANRQKFYINAIGGDSPITLNGDNKQFEQLTPAKLDRINRFIRLAKKVGYSFTDLDWVLQTLARIKPGIMSDSGQSIEAAIPVLAQFKQWQTDYDDMSVNQLCTFIGTLKDVGAKEDDSFFDTVFNHINASLPASQQFWLPDPTLEWTIPLTKNKAGTPEDDPKPVTALQTKLMAALEVSEDELTLMALQVIAAQASPTSYTIALSLENLSALYRLSQVPKMLGISVSDGIRLLKIMGTEALNSLASSSPSLTALTTIHQLIELNQWLQEAGIEVQTVVDLLANPQAKVAHGVQTVKSLLAQDSITADNVQTVAVLLTNPDSHTSHLSKVNEVKQLNFINSLYTAISKVTVGEISHGFSELHLPKLIVQRLTQLTNLKIVNSEGIIHQQPTFDTIQSDVHKFIGTGVLEASDFAFVGEHVDEQKLWEAFQKANIIDAEGIIHKEPNVEIETIKSQLQAQFSNGELATKIDEWAKEIVEIAQHRIKEVTNDLMGILAYYYQIQQKTLNAHLADFCEVAHDVIQPVKELANFKLGLRDSASESLLAQILRLSFVKDGHLSEDFGIPNSIKHYLNVLTQQALLVKTFQLSFVAAQSLVEQPQFFNIDPQHLKTGALTHNDLRSLYRFNQLQKGFQDTHNKLIDYFSSASQRLYKHELLELWGNQSPANALEAVNILWNGLLNNGYIDQHGVLQSKFTTEAKSLWQILIECDCIEENGDGGKIKNSIPSQFQKAKAQWTLTEDAVNKLWERLKAAGTLTQSATRAKDMAGWPQAQFEQLVNALWSDASRKTDQIPEYATVKGVFHLKKCFDLSSQLGLNIANLINLNQLQEKTTYDDYVSSANTLLAAVKANNTADWQTTYQEVHGPLNEQKRDALGDYVLNLNQKDHPTHAFKTLRDLSEHLLIDVETTHATDTSLVKEANNALQWYFHRCRMHLEPVTIDAELENWWPWMKHYRVWEANRKIFLYPENYIKPELRHAKTPLFKKLEEELKHTSNTQQNQDDPLRNHLDIFADEVAEKAFKTYLDGFAEIATLTITGGYFDQSEGNKQYFWVGRTRTEPYQFYYRKATLFSNAPNVIEAEEKAAKAEAAAEDAIGETGGNYAAKNKTAKEATSAANRISQAEVKKWFPWEKIDLTIQAEKVFPVFAFQRLFLFWLEAKEQSFSTDDGKSGKGIEVTICYSYHDFNGKWVHSQKLGDSFWVCSPPKQATLKTTKGSTSGEVIQTEIVSLNHFNVTDESIKQAKNVVSDARVALSYDREIIKVVFNKPQINQWIAKNKDGVELESINVSKLEITKTLDNNLVESLEPLEDKSEVITVKRVSSPLKEGVTIEDLITLSTKENICNFQYESSAASFPIFDADFLKNSSETVHQLSTSLFSGGIDTLLKVESQNAWISTDPTTVTGGPNSMYFWEIFFQAPFLIANHYNTAQRFEQAQKWYHYIFNPTTANAEDSKDKYWHFVGLQSVHNPTLSDSDNKSKAGQSNASLMQAYLDDPFEPHSIAALRPVAYQKTIVMHYIDNLLDWGDQLFRQYTRESIVEATVLYMMAYDLLGKKPTNMGPCPLPNPTTLKQILAEYSSKIPKFLLELEKSNITLPTTVDAKDNPNNSIPHTDFGIPENELFIQYWDRVQNRLYNIRHQLNLMGKKQALPLFQPPIDPNLLLEALAQGSSISQALAGLQRPVPFYRFNHLIEKAKSVTQTVIQFGNTLLSVLEKKDAEHLALLHSTQEKQILTLTHTIKQDQLQAAQNSTQALQKGKEGAQARLNHYNDIVNTGLLAGETAQLALLGTSIEIHAGAQAVKIGAAIAYGVPTIFGLADGGFHPGNVVHEGVLITEGIAQNLNFLAEISAIAAQHLRRSEDWRLQQTLAQHDVNQITDQISASQIQEQIAQQDIEVLEKNIDQNNEIADFLRNKFTNEELYEWMQGKLASLYFQSYQIAFDLALSAQRALQFELGREDTYIQLGYWDDLHKGLMAGEGLMSDLQRLDKAFLDQNERRFELEKTISLLSLDPKALLDLKTEGSCTFDLSEDVFDYDYPGHYCRQIKSVTLSFPAVVGPYQQIHATLTQLSHKTVLKPEPKAIEYLLKKDKRRATDKQPTTDILRQDWRANQQIATSQGVNDSGLFELNFRDERYLPFEGTGAVSSWQLDMPHANNALDFDGLTDVIMQLRYTALPGDNNFRNAVHSHLKKFNGSRFISLTHEFPSAWQSFVASKGTQPMKFKVTRQMFRMNLSAPKITQITLFYQDKNGQSHTKGEGLQLDLLGKPAVAFGSPISEALDKKQSDWTITKSTEGSIELGNVEQMGLIVHYEGELI